MFGVFLVLAGASIAIILVSMFEFLAIGDPEFFIRLLVAMFLGVAIGAERIMADKTAGMRTYALVSVGSALFVIISESVVQSYVGVLDLDPGRIAGQIIVGVGFLGAGMIIFRDSRLTGLTTASGLWVSAGIGMAAGFGLYSLAIFTTVLTLFIFTVLWFLEYKIVKEIAKKMKK